MKREGGARRRARHVNVPGLLGRAHVRQGVSLDTETRSSQGMGRQEECENLGDAENRATGGSLAGDWSGRERTRGMCRRRNGSG